MSYDTQSTCEKNRMAVNVERLNSINGSISKLLTYVEQNSTYLVQSAKTLFQDASKVTSTLNALQSRQNDSTKIISRIEDHMKKELVQKEEQ